MARMAPRMGRTMVMASQPTMKPMSMASRPIQKKSLT
jgi:hypothetical protein